MALLPTKKITALSPFTPPLTGDEEFECVQLGNSRKVTSRAFVLPTDSILTFSAMGGSLPGSRQVTEGIGIAFVDGGPGSTLSINATGAVAGPANPTALVGLAPVNGAAVTYLRSDAAPALDQGIAPVWTGVHQFTRAGAFSTPSVWLSNVRPLLRFTETDAAVDNGNWYFDVQGEAMRFAVINDTGSSSAFWLQVDRTGIVVDTVAFLATTVSVNGASVRDATNLFNTGTVPAARLPSSFSGLANPTASVGLVAVNGVATTAMRSDAAPPIDQAIVPTWTGVHVFTAGNSPNNPSLRLQSNRPVLDWIESDATADNGRWYFDAQGEQLRFAARNDAGTTSGVFLTVDRTLNVIDAIALVSTALTWNGNPILSTGTAFANPTGTVGLAAVNGVATTAMRSDAAPALSQAIVPTWTGVHSFTASRTVFGPTPFTPAVVDGVVVISSNQPNIFLYEADGAADNRLWRFVASGEDLIFQVRNDADSTGNTWLLVNRTGITIDTITIGATRVDITRPGGGGALDFFLSDQASSANERLWRTRANAAGQLQWGAANDALSTVNNFMLVDRTGATVDSVSFPTPTTASFLVGTSATITAMAIFSGTADVLATVSTSTASYPLKVWSNANSGDNGFILFITEGAGTTRGAIVYNRGAGLVAYNTTSDERRKTNIVDAPEASGIIDQIRVRSFDWRDSNVHLGHWFVAQELQEVFPLAVTQGDDTRDWAVDPAKLVPLLVKELQSVRRRLAVVEGTIH
jgi:hypothetical protein